MDVPASYRRHESESKIICMDAIESLICSRALMTGQMSAVNMDAESGKHGV